MDLAIDTNTKGARYFENGPMYCKNPQLFFERARVRFFRYEGIEAKVGAAMNVVKDVFLKAVFWIWLKPQFVWKELIVNAIAHRDYSIKGTDIQIKMFDDHLTVEGPGMLPGIVRLSNMREIHFSRNPKIVGLLHEYVREFGKNFTQNHLNPLIQAGRLVMTIPDKPNSKNQKYAAKCEG